MTVILLDLLCAVVTACTAALVKIFVQTINRKNLTAYVAVAVEAAEQIYKSQGLGVDKKAFAVDLICKKFPNVDGEEIDALIEAAVLGLNKAWDSATVSHI